LKQANGIRFKVLGDGKKWQLEIATNETQADYANYCYQFITNQNVTTIIDVPFSFLKQPNWGKKVVFNKNSIYALQFLRNADFGYDTSSIKIFDIEIY
jgi:hypothetical protein